MVRRGRADDDEVKLIDGDARVGEGPAGGLGRQVRGGFLRPGQPNSRPFDDPRVGGLDHGFQVGVGQDPAGDHFTAGPVRRAQEGWDKDQLMGGMRSLVTRRSVP